MECIVCSETYNKVSHKKVICCYCNFSSCHRCIQTYMLSQIQDPHCMHCKKAWAREFIDDRLSKQFINTELKSHRETLLFEKEKNLLPETQDNVRLVQLQEDMFKEMELISAEIFALQKKYDALEIQSKEINPMSMLPKQKMPKFRIPCIEPNCRGFMEDFTDTTLRCGICVSQLCSKCHERSETDHQCQPELIQTISLLHKETKRCPSCYVPIFKINGCDQMWCTACHITFDWKTGERVRGIIHNPHYHEYMEKQGHATVHLEVSYQRFDFLDTDQIVTALSEQNCPELVIYQLIEVYRYMVHYFEIDLQRLPTRFDEAVNLDLRIRYLRHHLSEDDFKMKLQRRQKDIEKKIEYRDIGETYVEIMNELFISFMHNRNIAPLLSNIQSITITTQDAISNLNRRYNSNMPLVRTLI